MKHAQCKEHRAKRNQQKRYALGAMPYATIPLHPVSGAYRISSYL